MKLSIPFHVGLEGILLSRGLEVGWKGKAERRNEAANETQQNKMPKSKEKDSGFILQIDRGVGLQVQSWEAPVELS